MLLNEELKAELPGMGSSSETPLAESLVQLKFHDSANRWKWYVIEFDGEATFFGLVANPVAVVAGQFTLTELESLSFDGEKLADESIKRDLSFQPMTVGELAKIEPGIKEYLVDRIPLTRLE